MRRQQFKHFLFLSFLMTTPSFAQYEEPSAPTPDDEIAPIWLFLGGGVSYVSLRANGVDGEIGKTGFQYHAGLDLSLMSTHWAVDFGGGYLYNLLDNYNSANELITVTTKTGYGNLGIRYRFMDLFSLGPVVQVLMGGGDVTFAETATRAQNAAAIGGAQLQLQLPLGSSAIRITGSALTDITIPDRQVYWFMLGAQIGFSFGGGPSEPLAPTPQAREGSFYISGNTIKVTLSDQKVYFETAKSSLTAKVAAIMGQIGGYLAQHPEEWRLIQIDGHADYRGTQDYNYILSANRAAEVGKVFVNSGIAPERVAFKAYGKNRAADPGLSDASLARNRRVEIKITGVKNPQQLLIPIDQIWRTGMGQ